MIESIIALLIVAWAGILIVFYAFFALCWILFIIVFVTSPIWGLGLIIYLMARKEKND
jgi:hypothetical protein